ncbi:MAG: MBL fold metallo-hydrolase [Acidobacteria bacterium]|nr:MBL fold metallo-hydrolase [Acidobacteriota bacterium]
MAHSVSRRSRRGFLKETLGTVWTSAALMEQAFFRATAANAQATGGLPSLFDISKVAEGVYSALAKPVTLLNSNAAIFELSNELLIVDSHSKPSAVVALVAQLKREVTPKPVRYIVNSHFHWDHAQGNGAYRKLAPRADIIATEATRKLLSEEAPKRLKESLDQTAQALEAARKKLVSAATAEEKAYYQRAVRESSEYLAEMRATPIDLPNVTLTQDFIIHDRMHDLHLSFRGRAHTAGDVVVHCPRKRVVATGDMLHGFLPYLGDSFPLEWPRTLLSVAQLDFDRVIGGHGLVQNNKDVLYMKARYVEELAEAVATGRRAGKSAAQLGSELTPDKLKSLTGAYMEYLGGNLMKFQVQEYGAKAADVIRGAVQLNVAHAWARLS